MIGLAVALTLTAGQTWAVGTEREVDEGVYMKVVSSEQGWRVWRIETRNGVQCRAYKSARGRAHPVPVGVNSMMDRVGTPFLEVYWEARTAKFYSEWHGAHYGGMRAKYRVPGARFWEETPPDPEAVNEQSVELSVDSYEYPAIFEGKAEERANFDLTGIRWATEAIRTCNAAG
jgi:hypothetical protein